MRTSIAGAVSLAKRATCAEVEQQVARRDRRAEAAIAAAMRRQVPDVGAVVETVARWAVEFEAQVAVVACLGMDDPSHRYAVVTSSYFGFRDPGERPPLRVELRIVGWTLCRWSAERLAAAHLRRARIRAAIAYAVEQGRESREYVEEFVDEAVDAVLAEDALQVTR